MKSAAKCFDTKDFRELAKRRMPRIIFDALDGAAGREYSSQLNVKALESVRLQPRILIDVEQRRLKTNFLYKTWGLPFGIAPMGMCNLFWPRADQSLAALAQDIDVPIGVSTMASSSLEQMLEDSGGNAWFQLYAATGDSTDALVERAYRAGYKALILTADVPVLAPRIRDQKNGFTVPFRFGPRQLLDFASHPWWSVPTLFNGAPEPANVAMVPKGQGVSSDGAGFEREGGRGTLTWEFLKKLRQSWPNKLILKGVMSPTDADMAIDIGVDAIYVSNHGGRQLDAAPPAIRMLPLVKEAVGARCPILFDSGVRNGEDIVKALALGADFVMIGRPMLYAFAAHRDKGLKRLANLLESQIGITLAQVGCSDIGQVSDTTVSDYI